MIGVIKRKENVGELSTVRAKSFATALTAVLPVFFCIDPPAIFYLIPNMFEDNEP